MSFPSVYLQSLPSTLPHPLSTCPVSFLTGYFPLKLLSVLVLIVFLYAYLSTYRTKPHITCSRKRRDDVISLHISKLLMLCMRVCQERCQQSRDALHHIEIHHHSMVLFAFLWIDIFVPFLFFWTHSFQLKIISIEVISISMSNCHLAKISFSSTEGYR